MNDKGLKALFAFIAVSFIFSLIFTFISLKNYRRPKNLVIKASSAANFEEIATSLKKALFPLKSEGYQLILTGEAAGQLEGSLKGFFSMPNLNSKEEPLEKQSKVFEIFTQEIDVHQSINEKNNCLNKSLFAMQRKIKKWTSSFFYTLCQDKKNKFVLYYSKK